MAMEDEHGIIQEGSGFAKDGEFTMPDGLPWADEGTTGMLYSQAKSHDATNVMEFIVKKSAGYPKYKKNIWDCEDHAFLAAADIRCRFPGQPVAIAIGKATFPPKLAGVDHAVNYLWFERKVGRESKWDTVQIFDSTLENPRFIPDFDPKVFIPLPVSGLNNHKDFSPVDKFEFLPSAAFQLDERSYDFGLIQKVINVLKQRPKPDYLRCLKPSKNEYKHDKEWDQFRKDTEIRTYNDEVFHAFANIRKEFMGAPVGIAFGAAPDLENPDAAMLVLWSSADNPEYWHYDDNAYLKETDLKFKARIVIV